MSNIIFIGDSFCGSFNQGHDLLDKVQALPPGAPVVPFGLPYLHPDIVATNYNAQLYCFGYNGKSWWYSYQKFNNAIKQDPSILKNAMAIVFCHTGWNRINSSDQNLCITLAPHNFGKFKPRSQFDAEYAEAYAKFTKYIYDEELQRWSQQQYFKELKELYCDIKTIHFHGFPHSIPYSNLLPGMVYSNLCLYNISYYQNIDKDFTSKAYNHFSDHNNIALANLIIQSIDNYVPGQYEIDTTKFEQVIRTVDYNKKFLS